jgi:hypothetical protein
MGISAITGTFAEWQPQYAAHGIATFPVAIVDGDKRPAIKGYMRAGLRASEQLAIKFASAASLFRLRRSEQGHGTGYGQQRRRDPA